MAIDMDEPIRVAAVFNCGGILPVWFDRKGIQVRVRDTAFCWTTREGCATLMHFSVTDGQNLYEICFNTETLGWKLVFSEVP